MTISALIVGQVLVLLFFAVAMLQSGLDKALDWTGNLGWLQGHFEKTWMGKMVPLLLFVVTVLETIVGLTCLVGAGLLLFGQGSEVAQWAMTGVLLTLLMLFFGQRVAKDYPGAMTLAVYFGVGVMGLGLLTAR